MSPRHEQFAALVAAGKSATDAYAEVYPRASRTTAAREGHRLLKNPKISQEVARRGQTVVQRIEDSAVWSTAGVLETLKSDHDTAVSLEQMGSAVRCLELAGKHLRMWGDVKGGDVNVTVQFLQQIRAMPEAALREMLGETAK